MKLAFTKMQGAGNDFVVLDCTRTPFNLSRHQLRSPFSSTSRKALVTSASARRQVGTSAQDRFIGRCAAYRRRCE